MEKTLRKCGSSSSGMSAQSNQLDLNCLPFLIPKRYQIHGNEIPGQEYHLDIHKFNYTFVVEKAVLAAKAERELAELAEQQKADEAAAAVREAEAAVREAEAAVRDAASEDDCEVIPEPLAHPTNPFLALHGDVLIPTPSTHVNNKQKDEPSIDNQDIIKSFDAENSNPFDGAELRSLSNFDALKSVLAPEHVHDFSVFENNGAPTPPTAANPPPDPVYASVVHVLPTPPVEPVYSTVNKSPAVIRSRALDKESILLSHSENGEQVQIHGTRYMAIGAAESFAVSQEYTPPVEETSSSFPRIPQEMVARTMQRLNYDQEKCFEFLTDMSEMIKVYDCSADIAEAVSLLDTSDKKKEEAIITIKQFSELGFPQADIIKGFVLNPTDRDALLDYLTTS